jgi:hypothetical protein
MGRGERPLSTHPSHSHATVKSTAVDPFRDTHNRISARPNQFKSGSPVMLLLLQMPVVFAIRIFDIGLYNISSDTTIIMHNATALIGVRLAE